VSSRIELFERIRRDRRLDPEVSVRTLAKRYRVSRNTVTLALESALPPPRAPMPTRASLLTPVMSVIDEWLREDLTAPPKQRHTVRRIFNRLAEECRFTDASYTTVLEHVRRRRPEIAAEARRQQPVVRGMVPQLHEPGAEAEVDFADVWIRVGGELTQCHLFTLRMSYSGKAIHRVFLTQSQEAFLEGHVEAFRVLGGVPTRHIRYDNLKPAVNQVCFGDRRRVESQRWTAFRSHYGFDAFYCIPGKDGAHEKGGVEQDGGRFRRTHLVPVPDVDSIAGLNERLEAIDAAEDARIVMGAAIPVGHAFAVEERLLRPLPDDDFDTGITLTPTVANTSRITVRQCYYSVPARFIGRKVRVSLRANELLVFDGRQIVARHPRIKQRGSFRDELDHFLEILLAKPGALAGSSALAQARADGVFTATHERFWQAACQAYGDAKGTRALVEVLLLHRHRPADAVLAAIATVLDAGSVSPELVAIEARKAAGGIHHRHDTVDLSDLDLDLLPSASADTDTGPGRSLPLPTVDIYDQLLTRRRKGARR
jgi:transposase